MKRLLAIICSLLVVLKVEAQERVELRVASTTDVHGRLRAWDYYADRAEADRGLSRAATIVDSLRKAHPDGVVLVDAGDLLQGNPLTYVAARLDTAGPHPVIAAMNAMQYDAAALGNHEFNYGLPTLRSALKGARFPFLAANLTTRGAEKRFHADYALVKRGPLRVAIVGATTPGSMVWDRENLRGRVQVGAMLPALRRTVRALRSRADVVVVVMHSGLDGASSYNEQATGVAPENEAARVAHEVPGVDLIVYGHSHREMADTTVNGVLLMQPRNWAASVGVATLTVERRGPRWRVVAKRGQLVRSAGHAEHPAVVAATERTHTATVSWVRQTLGSTPVAWRADSARVRDTPLIDFILEVQRKATGADLAATAAFDLNASLDTGAVTVAEVARLYPYDNTLRAVRVTGKQLREFLDYSSRYYRTIGSNEAKTGLVDPDVPGFNFDIIAGADYTLDISRPLGARVTRLRVKDREVRDIDTFTLALNNYRQTGGGGFAMLAGAPVVYDKQEEIRDLLIAEVQRRGTINPSDYHTVNWQLEPLSMVDSVYRTIRSLPFDRTTAPVTRPGGASPHLTQGRWLRVLGTSDFHGGLEARDISADGVVRGGAAGFATVLQQARAECVAPACESVWVDGGDQWQGTAASAVDVGRPVTALFNRLGLNAAALGNHEFDWGVDSMRARLRENRFPVLAANFLDTLGTDIPWMPDDTLLTIGGVKVGVIGIMTRETISATRRSIIRPFTVAPAASIIDARARALRARGADAVVVVGHVGAGCARNDLNSCTGELIDLVNAVTERIDAWVGGHSHRGAAAMVNGMPVVQAYQKGSALGIIDVPLSAGVERRRPELRNVRADSTRSDPVIAAWVDSLTRDVNKALAQVVAQVGEPIRRAPPNGLLGNLIADAQRVIGEGDVAIMNTGGVRVDLRLGPVTRGDIFEVQPFGNMLVRWHVTGEWLLQQLERAVSNGRVHLSGVVVEMDTSRAPGSRLLSARLTSGKAIDPTGRYRLILTDFLAEGNDRLVSARPDREELLPIPDREAFERYLRSLPQPVRAPTDQRIIHRQ